MGKVKPTGKRTEIPCIQGEPDWFRARIGLPTASMFHAVLAQGEGKVRGEYMRKLAGEIITETPMENYKNEYMERGNGMEPELRRWYSFRHQNVELRQVGFITNGKMGCSPDSLIGTKGGLEIKTQAPHLLIDTLQRNEMPPKHKAQLQGTMLVAELEWMDLLIGFTGMPKFEKRIMRDDAYIATLVLEIDQFNRELAALVTKIRAME
jgi:hypothetical protein